MKRLVILLLYITPFFAIAQSKDADVELVHLLTKDTTLRTREGTIGYNYTTHKHYFIRNGGAKSYLPGPATSVTLPGSTTQILYNNAGVLGATGNHSYNPSTNTFIAGTGISITGTGTRNNNFYIGLNHTDAVTTGTGFSRWNMFLGEEHQMVNNSGAFGFNFSDDFVLGSFFNKLELQAGGLTLSYSGTLGGYNNIIAHNLNTATEAHTIIGGTKNKIIPSYSNSTTGLIAGNFILGGGHNISDGHGSGAMGYWSQSSGTMSLVHGYATTFVGIPSGSPDATFSTTVNVGHTGSIPTVLASGRHAINMSANSPHQTAGFGATGDYSVILGGVNGDNSGKNSVVLGGYEVHMSDSATAAVPRLYSRGGNSLGITTVTTNTTVNKWDYYTILVDATSGNITITLPAAASSTNVIFIVKKIDASANTVTIDANASELIDGSTTAIIVSQTDFRVIHCDATSWWITGR